MRKHGEDLLNALLAQPDAVLAVVSGIIGVWSAIQSHRNIYIRNYTYFTRADDEYDVIGIATTALGIAGVLAIVLGLVRLKGICKSQFNKYLAALISVLVTNFFLGILLTDTRAKLPGAVEKVMVSRQHEIVVSQLSLGVGFAQADAWDFLQIQMSCCGVESYREYLIRHKTAKEQPIPLSCCVMKAGVVIDGQPVPNNPSQCMLDAAHKVSSSVFLRVQGCLAPLTRWLTHYVSHLTAMLFVIIALQAVGLLYLSWKGYSSSSGTKGNR